MLRIGRKSYLEFQIAEVERELKAVSREIRIRERNRRRQERLSGRAAEGSAEQRGEAEGRRLANFLSAGSFQTIAHPKFSSDLVRRRRWLIGGAAVGLLAAAWIIWKLVI